MSRPQVIVDNLTAEEHRAFKAVARSIPGGEKQAARAIFRAGLELVELPLVVEDVEPPAAPAGAKFDDHVIDEVDLEGDPGDVAL